MNKTNKPEVEILDEDLNLDIHITADAGADKVWPEHYETYLGDGIYIGYE